MLIIMVATLIMVALMVRGCGDNAGEQPGDGRDGTGDDEDHRSDDGVDVFLLGLGTNTCN